jgi:hypothetical protein
MFTAIPEIKLISESHAQHGNPHHRSSRYNIPDTASTHTTLMQALAYWSASSSTGTRWASAHMSS